MYLPALITRLLFFSLPKAKEINNGACIDAVSDCHCAFTLTRHTQLTPSPSFEAPSTTMLATMPCTPYPGRTPHALEPIPTRHALASTWERLESRAVRKKHENRLAASTQDFNWLEKEIGREMRLVEIVIVEWLIMCWLEAPGG